MEQHSESSVLIFTDGSVCNGPVGSGACAAVVFPIGANEQIFTITSAVGTKMNSIVNSELEPVPICLYYFVCAGPRL